MSSFNHYTIISLLVLIIIIMLSFALVHRSKLHENIQIPERLSHNNSSVHISAATKHISTSDDKNDPTKPKLASTEVHFKKTGPVKIDYLQRYLDAAPNDIMHLAKPNYLPQFKNPCWLEITNDNKDSSTQNIKDTCLNNQSSDCENHNSRLRCLPYFMIIGQPKSGSTDLYMNINLHPDVIPAKRKETHYWAFKMHCNCCKKPKFNFKCNWPDTWSQYLDTFKRAAERVSIKPQGITGDGSVNTLSECRWWWNYAVNKNDEEPALTTANFIRHFLPDVKLLIILRNPIDRLYSDYLYITRNTKSAENFHNAVETVMQRYHSCIKQHTIRHCVYYTAFDVMSGTTKLRVNMGFYALFIKDWFKVFPREQFLIMRLDDYSKDKKNHLKKVFKFLNLSDADTGDHISQHNKRRQKDQMVGEMYNKTRKLLTTLYRPYNEELAALLGDKLYLWDDS